MIIDGMMHLEVVGECWEGLVEDVLEHYDAAGIDKGVVLNTWMPSRESNDRTREACRRYPDRFIPFGCEALDELSRDLPQLTWILPHMGCYYKGREMQRWCEFARSRANVYLDTSAADRYADLDRALEWAGADKITFASDGFLFSPLVEKAKIDTLRLPTPHRTPRITEEQYAMIMGGTMARLLGLGLPR